MDRDKGNMSVKRKLEPDPVTPPPSQPPVKKKDGRGRPRKYPLPDQVRPVQPPPPVQVSLNVINPVFEAGALITLLLKTCYDRKAKLWVRLLLKDLV